MVTKADFYAAEISLAAKGLLGLYACLADDLKEVDLPDLAARCCESPEEVAAVLRELEVAGLVATGEAAERLAEGERARIAAEQAAWENAPPAPPVVDERSVVYYLRRADGAIKIGFSIELDRRMSTLAEAYGPLELLASEPGGWHKENERHRQFERLRLHRNREWFKAERGLMSHIWSLQDAEASR